MAKKKPEKPKAKPKKKKKKVSLQIVEVAPVGTYGISAPDILQSIALRKKLQASIERMKKTTRDFVKKGVESGAVSEEDCQELLGSLEEVDSAIVPIAYGIDDGEDGEDGDGGG